MPPLPTIVAFRDIDVGTGISVRRRADGSIKRDGCDWTSPVRGEVAWFKTAPEFGVYLLGFKAMSSAGDLVDVTTVASIARIKPGSFFSTRKSKDTLRSIYRVKACDPSIDVMLSRTSFSRSAYTEYMLKLKDEIYENLSVWPMTIPEICDQYREPRKRVTTIIDEMMGHGLLVSRKRKIGAMGKPASEYSSSVFFGDFEMSE